MADLAGWLGLSAEEAPAWERQRREGAPFWRPRSGASGLLAGNPAEVRRGFDVHPDGRPTIVHRRWWDEKSFAEVNVEKAQRELGEFVDFWLSGSEGLCREHGGFCCELFHSGKRASSKKFAWYQARGAWVFARLSRRLGAVGGPPAEYMAIALRAAKFFMAKCMVEPLPREDPGERAVRCMVRSARAGCFNIVGPGGETLDVTAVDEVGYSSMFFAEALIELWACHRQAAAARQGWTAEHVPWWVKHGLRFAAVLTAEFLRRADDPTRTACPSYWPQQPPAPGTRCLGYSMIPMRVATQALQAWADFGGAGDPGGPVAAFWERCVSDRCVAEIMDKYYDPNTGLFFELAASDFGRPADDNAGVYYYGHALESLWMVMDECTRRIGKTPATTTGVEESAPLIDAFREAANRFQRTFECARDRAFGGLLVGMEIKDGGGWSKSLDEKIGWLHQEALVGLLTIAASTAVGDELRTWAINEHHALSAWVARKFELRPHGYSGWMVGGKRDIAFVEHGDAWEATATGDGAQHRKENYHTPRYLMMTADLLGQILEREILKREALNPPT